jgi:hypothetical protein
MRIRNIGIHKVLEGVAMLCLCLVLTGIVIASATGSTSGATAKGPLPVIMEFSATPMVLPDGQAAVYAFSVSGASKIEIIEAGDIIKEVNGPASSNIKGTIKGRTTYQIRTGDSKTFDTTLVAINSNGKLVKKLTLSFANVIPAGTAAAGPGSTDNATGARSPKWLALITTPVLNTIPAGFSQSTWPPTFAKCSSDCNYCLRPEDAKDRGFTQRCSDQPCYYSPDKQQTWYCYSKPATVWCCKDGKVVETAKEKCVEAGGTAYATEAEALKACPQLGYCCQNGRLTSATLSTCNNAGGTFYTDPVQAGQACQQLGYCCQNGRLTSATTSTCKNAGGTFYTDPVQAGQACQQLGYCCQNGRLTSATTSTCKEAGGTFYTDPNQAAQACQQLGYCCQNGRLTSATTSTCKNAGGTFYTDPNQAAAACQPQGYCCVNGQLSTTTSSACRYAGGTFYTDQTQARACYQPATCWCCSGGKAFQTTQTQCVQSRGTCYSSQTEATRACTPVYRPPTIK